jgi:16S rRNA (cytidine1402-2'-O)-methyltransferase
MIGRDGGDGTSRGGRLAGPAAHAPSASAATVAAIRCAMARERTAGTGIDIGERVRMAADTDGKDLAGDGGSPAYRAEAGTLYVVATPLGNLRDVTLRALDVLGTADVVAAEDTRMTARLLGHYGVLTKTVSLHAHNESQRAQSLIAMLRDGRSVALVSDAGTPAISDPGARLVQAVRAAGFPVVPIPGPSAVATAVSAAGLMASAFVFAGFLPQQAKARREFVASLAPLAAALVFYEAPHRVRETVADLVELLGGERVLVVARELTKTFETITALRLADAPEWFAADANRERGEFVLIVDAAPATEKPATLTAEAERWLVALLAELPPARAARVVAGVTGVPRGAVYARALALKPGSG